MNSKRRKTILRENNIFEILKSLSCLPNQKKLPPYSFICRKSALSVKNLSPEYFDCLPPLTEIELIETEQTEPPICINFILF